MAHTKGASLSNLQLFALLVFVSPTLAGARFTTTSRAVVSTVTSNEESTQSNPNDVLFAYILPAVAGLVACIVTGISISCFEKLKKTHTFNNPPTTQKVAKEEKKVPLAEVISVTEEDTFEIHIEDKKKIAWDNSSTAGLKPPCPEGEGYACLQASSEGGDTHSRRFSVPRISDVEYGYKEPRVNVIPEARQTLWMGDDEDIDLMDTKLVHHSSQGESDEQPIPIKKGTIRMPVNVGTGSPVTASEDLERVVLRAKKSKVDSTEHQSILETYRQTMYSGEKDEELDYEMLKTEKTNIKEVDSHSDVGSHSESNIDNAEEDNNSQDDEENSSLYEQPLSTWKGTLKRPFKKLKESTEQASEPTVTPTKDSASASAAMEEEEDDYEMLTASKKATGVPWADAFVDGLEDKACEERVNTINNNGDNKDSASGNKGNSDGTSVVGSELNKTLRLSEANEKLKAFRTELDQEEDYEMLQQLQDPVIENNKEKMIKNSPNENHEKEMATKSTENKIEGKETDAPDYSVPQKSTPEDDAMYDNLLRGNSDMLMEAGTLQLNEECPPPIPARKKYPHKK
eukprot:m.346331 g.346331  ORF g.346331 m.346331 type:complete len:571 (+) comp28731_c0_seq1:208-1920(+)